MARPNQWRATGQVVKFGPFDALAAVPLVLMIAHIRLWTFVLALVVFVVFGILSRMGYRPKVALRRLRSLVVGSVRQGKAWWARPQKRI